jgi:hypothetical protein
MNFQAFSSILLALVLLEATGIAADLPWTTNAGFRSATVNVATGTQGRISSQWTPATNRCRSFFTNTPVQTANKSPVTARLENQIRAAGYPASPLGDVEGDGWCEHLPGAAEVSPNRIVIETWETGSSKDNYRQSTAGVGAARNNNSDQACLPGRCRWRWRSRPNLFFG